MKETSTPIYVLYCHPTERNFHTSCFMNFKLQMTRETSLGNVKITFIRFWLLSFTSVLYFLCVCCYDCLSLFCSCSFPCQLQSFYCLKKNISQFIKHVFHLKYIRWQKSVRRLAKLPQRFLAQALYECLIFLTFIAYNKPITYKRCWVLI